MKIESMLKDSSNGEETQEKSIDIEAVLHLTMRESILSEMISSPHRLKVSCLIGDLP